MYTGSIPVLASNKINDLRHPSSPSLPFLKQPLKLSRFGLASFHLISRLLSTLRELSLPDALAQGNFLVEAGLAPRLTRLPAYVQQSETRR